MEVADNFISLPIGEPAEINSRIFNDKEKASRLHFFGVLVKTIFLYSLHLHSNTHRS